MWKLLKNVVDRTPLRRAIRRLHHAWQRRMGRFGPGEPELNVLLNIVQKGDCVIDVGANVGHYTVSLGQRVGPEGFVIAIEPETESHELLSANINGAGLTNVAVFNAACSDHPALTGITVPQDRDGYRWLTRAHLEANGRQRVLALPLDDLCGPVRGRVRAIKIDVEGSEHAVLVGAEQTLRERQPLLIVENSEDHAPAWLTELGYRRFELRGSPNVIYAAGEDIDRVTDAAARDLEVQFQK